MAEGPLSQQREHACVPRSHLPQLIHSGPGSAEKRAGSAPQVQAAYTSFTAFARWRKVPRSDRRCYLDQGKPCRGRRPRYSRSLGGRPARWQQEQSYRNPGGTTFANHYADQSASKDTTTVVAALSKHVLKLPATRRRSLTWDRGHEMAKHRAHGRHECESLLLRSAESLAETSNDAPEGDCKSRPDQDVVVPSMDPSGLPLVPRLCRVHFCPSSMLTP
jgi:hypothetical protein